MRTLLRTPATRRYFVAWGQSSIGTGAGFVALLLLAHDTFASPWAIAVVLLADQLPGMTLGPVLGALVDRVPRRTAAIAADLFGCAAFCGLALASSFPAVVALAVVAGVGSALGSVASMAGLPEVVEPEDLPAATSLYGILEEAGIVLGPLAAAVVLAGASPSALMLVNGLTFGVSALLLCTVPFHRRSAEGVAAEETLRASTRAGLRALRELPGVRTIILTSTAAVLAFGLVNVGELLFAENALDAGGSGFSLLVAAMSIGMMAGALAGSRAGNPGTWKREYLLGLALMGVSLVLVSGMHALLVVLPLLALCGYGNGIAVVHERLLLQHTVPPALHGRIFGVRRMLVSWAFCGSYVLAGLIASSAGPRVLLLCAGIGMLAAFACGAVALTAPSSPARRALARARTRRSPRPAGG